MPRPSCSTPHGGWFASGPDKAVAECETYSSTSDTDAVGAAPAAGYVIVDVGTRSRGAESAEGLFVGKGPEATVDAKAASAPPPRQCC